jgi:hypothetical protein
MDKDIETLQYTRLRFVTYRDLNCHVLTKTTASLVQYANYVRNVLHAEIALDKGHLQMPLRLFHFHQFSFI